MFLVLYIGTVFNALEEKFDLDGCDKFIFHICNIAENIHCGKLVEFRLDVVKDFFWTSTAETTSGIF